MSKHCCGSGCRSGERETKAENIRLAGKGRERCAGGKEEKEGQSSVFFLHPDEIRHELPGHRVSGADSAEHLPGAGLPGPAVWLQAGFAEEPGCGDGLCPDGAGAAHLGPGGAGHDHAGQQRHDPGSGHRPRRADSVRQYPAQGEAWGDSGDRPGPGGAGRTPVPLCPLSGGGAGPWGE